MKWRLSRWSRLLLAGVLLLTLGGVTSALAGERDQPSDRPQVQSSESDRWPNASGVPPTMRRWLQGLPPEMRRGAVARIRQMPDRQRRAFFRRWERMSDVQRRGLQARFERRAEQRLIRDRYERMTPAERRRFRAKAHRWGDMKPSERERMRRRLEHFSRLSASEQEALVERSFPDAGPEERARKLRQLRAASR